MSYEDFILEEVSLYFKYSGEKVSYETVRDFEKYYYTLPIEVSELEKLEYFNEYKSYLVYSGENISFGEWFKTVVMDMKPSGIRQKNILNSLEDSKEDLYKIGIDFSMDGDTGKITFNKI